MFIAALFIIAPNWNQPKSTGEWLNKLWYIHKVEYWLAIKKECITNPLGESQKLTLSGKSFGYRNQ